MATKRDLVEAHAFSRRRLVTAFVSGAPGGREVEPARPTRAIVAGIALGVLILAGAALASIFAGRSPANWTDPGIIISKENGNHYVILAKGQDPQPVLNPVSARLLMGQVEPTSVKQEDISERSLGVRIGIYDAPNNIPAPELMRNSGWTACTAGDSATKFHLGEQPGVSNISDTGMLVYTGEGKTAKYHLIAQSGEPGHGYYRYAFGARAVADRLSSDLGLDGEKPFEVDTKWLSLFPKGPDLTLKSFGLPADKTPVSYGSQMGTGSFLTGDLVRNVSSGQVYVLGPKEPRLLDEFAETVYQVLSNQRGDPKPISGKSGSRLPDLQEWPRVTPKRLDADEVCGVLNAASGRAATVQLAINPTDEESAQSLGSNTLEIAVQPGFGAYVNVGQQGDTKGGTPVLIDMDAKRYRLGGPKGQTAELLGVTSVKPPTVPDAWTENFRCGPELSQDAARRKPDPKAAKCG